jgi:hypothetical protein
MTVLPDFRQTEFGLQVRLPQTLIMEAPAQSTATISAKTNSPVIEKLYRGTT